jgi:GDP-4-dehydro-6-deoxy-D-mannose reductase
MSRQVLITGAGGFVGRHLCAFLASQPEPPKIYGIDLARPACTNCDWFDELNIADAKSVKAVIEHVEPDVVVHLAGLFSGVDAQELYRTNILGASALMEAIREFAPRAYVVAAGSAAEYGAVQEDRIPIDESIPCHPVASYGVSKLLATELFQHYYRIHRIRTTIVRPFQLIGRGITAKLAPGAFAQQIAQAIEAGRQVIEVGNLESVRDYLDVRDFVEAIWILCNSPAPGEIFNVCSGRGTRIAELLQQMIKASGQELSWKQDTSRLRGQDEISIAIGSYDKLAIHCGWHPRRSLQQSIQMMFPTKL